MSLHQSIRTLYRLALVSSCHRGPCKLDLASLPNPTTILDGDLYAANWQHKAKICDFLVFWSHPDVGAAAVEIKGRSWDANEVVAQLEGGADAILRIVGTAPLANFCPVLVHQGVKHPAQLKTLAAKRVVLRGLKYRVQRCRCGDRFPCDRP